MPFQSLIFNHAIVIGASATQDIKTIATGTAGQYLQSGGASVDPVFSTATLPSVATGTGTILRADGTNWVATTSTYPTTTTINQILFSSSANTITGITAGNSATLVSTSTGVPTWSSSMTNGQVILGSTGATPVAGTITSTGGTVTVSTGAGTLNIEVAGGGFSWVDATSATQALAVNTGYVTDRGAGVTYTLPASATLGQTIKIVGKLGIAVITPNANQQILIGATSGSVGVTGTATANNVGDCLELICITAGASTVWRAASVVGTWTLA